jgi:hypothetical protein
LPKAEVPNIKAKYVLDKKELEAPIAAHQRVGRSSSMTVTRWWRTGRWSRWKPLIKAACSLA